VGRKSSPWKEIQAVNRIIISLDVNAEIYVRLASENPAVSENDDQANTNRIAETVSIALALGDMDIFLDTFADFDRGYFPRTGIVDRRYNPRMASYVFRHLQSALVSCQHKNIG